MITSPLWTPSKAKISTVITATNPANNHEFQRSVLAQWSKSVPRIVLSGPIKPPTAYGIRHVTQNELSPLRNIIGAYLFQIPGGEVCALAAPNIHINSDLAKLFEHVNGQRLGLAWAAYTTEDGERPVMFIMSASVAAHIMRDIPADMTMVGDAWLGWVHAWLTKNMMPPRYFNADHYGVCELASVSLPAPAPVAEVVNAYEPSPAEVEEREAELAAKATKKRKAKKKAA